MSISQLYRSQCPSPSLSPFIMSLKLDGRIHKKDCCRCPLLGNACECYLVVVLSLRAALSDSEVGQADCGGLVAVLQTVGRKARRLAGGFDVMRLPSEEIRLNAYLCPLSLIDDLFSGFGYHRVATVIPGGFRYVFVQRFPLSFVVVFAARAFQQKRSPSLVDTRLV